MNNLWPVEQPVWTRTTAGRGAEPEARRAIERNASDHGPHPHQDHDEEASGSFFMILLRALGAMHT